MQKQLLELIRAEKAEIYVFRNYVLLLKRMILQKTLQRTSGVHLRDSSFVAKSVIALAVFQLCFHQ
jgi:hypothetical protein